ncbi:alpha/beta hydrolase family esterase [Blastopirellula marina]|uniref:Phospholipase/carboxylesterase/thioesterase domain-containing protein n=1 Tax=Blastopirellula marina TaxID=124 RepID=A0A2S8GMB8_9BACT|nr:PHB depolymerase family esterase [Blastopirellula marina]PQO45154.1 hypothetical protein C5Y93_16615 [Blastopirellula marina]
MPLYPAPLRSTRWLLAVLLLALLFTLGIVVFRWLPAASPIITHQSLQVGSDTRTFRLASPPDPPSTGSLPLIVALHGVGDSADSMAAYSGLDQLAADGQAYVVYPEAQRGMWNVFAIAADQQADNRDLQMIDRLIAELRDQLAPRDVRLVGMSNGATFAQLIQQSRSDIERTVAHSGSRPPELPFGPPLPIMLAVGTADLAADPMRRNATAYRETGYLVELLEVPGLGHAWATTKSQAIRDFLTQPGEAE